jgi:hypothetical protein
LIFGPWRPERAVAPAPRTAASRPRWAHTPRQASDHWSMHCSRPCRTAILVLSPCATSPRTPRRPPNFDVAVRAPRRPCTAIGRRTSPPPHHSHAVDGRDPLLKSHAPTEGVKLASARIAPSTEPPLPPTAMPTPSSSLRLLVLPMRVALACLRTRSSYAAHLLLRPSRQLAGIRGPAAAAGQPLPNSCLRLLSKPMGPHSISSRTH